MSEYAKSQSGAQRSPEALHRHPEEDYGEASRYSISELNHAIGNHGVQSLAQGGQLLSRVMVAFRAGLGNQVIQRLLARDQVSGESALKAGPTGIAQREIKETIEEKFTSRGSQRRTMYYSTEDDPRNPKLFAKKSQAEKHEAELLEKKRATPTTVGATSKPASLGATATVAVPTATPTTPKPATVPVVAGPTGGTKTATIARPGPVKQADRPLSDVDNAEWLRAWEAKRREVYAVLEGFAPRFKALDPGAELRVRGSLASGIKGNPSKVDPKTGERLLFNPTDFDIDAYVESDALYRQALDRAGTDDEAARGQITGSSLPAVNEIIRDMRASLASVAGNRDAPKGNQWKFNVIIRSSRNAAYTTNKDRQSMKDIKKPAAWGEPMTIRPPDK